MNGNNKYESLKVELQNRIDIFNKKWMTKCQEEYNGDFEKLYNANISNILNDVKPIWEICFKINCVEEWSATYGKAEKDREYCRKDS